MTTPLIQPREIKTIDPEAIRDALVRSNPSIQLPGTLSVEEKSGLIDWYNALQEETVALNTFNSVADAPILSLESRTNDFDEDAQKIQYFDRLSELFKEYKDLEEISRMKLARIKLLSSQRGLRKNG